jgi:hypothetical protein
MAIAYVKKKAPRKRLWIVEWLFPKMIRETRCTECGRPFLEHPEREPMQRFEQGNVELLLYEDKTALRTEYRLRVGVWRPSQDSYYFAQLFSKEHFEDLQCVVTDAVEFVAGCEEG